MFELSCSCTSGQNASHVDNGERGMAGFEREVSVLDIWGAASRFGGVHLGYIWKWNF